MSIFKICSNRLLSANVPMRICLTSKTSMSSSSSVDSPRKDRRRESFRSILASVFGGNVDPADPNDAPIPADKVRYPDISEQSTGEAKLLLLAFENGFLDPYCNLPTVRKGRGTKDNPVPIESFVNERMVGCICEGTQNYIKFTTVYRGEPKRCNCGHWLKIVDAPKFWEKIPKEDLLSIPYFLELELEGKLDKLLSGELDKENEEKERIGHH